MDNGHIRIVDRLKEMALVSEFNVYPNEVENVVFTHPDVTECAVVGVTELPKSNVGKILRRNLRDT